MDHSKRLPKLVTFARANAHGNKREGRSHDRRRNRRSEYEREIPTRCRCRLPWRRRPETFGPCASRRWIWRSRPAPRSAASSTWPGKWKRSVNWRRPDFIASSRSAPTAPHLDVVLGVTPVPLGIDVSEFEDFLLTQEDLCHCSGDFSSHERLAWSIDKVGLLKMSSLLSSASLKTMTGYMRRDGWR